MPKLKEVVKRLEQLAPPYLAESWDHVGLMVGSMQQEVNKVLCALDLNEEVVEEAIKEGVDCIVTHHPFLFKPLKAIDLETREGRIIKSLLANDIAVYAMHTNYDVATGGLNDYLVKGLGLRDIRVLAPTHTLPQYKVVIYVPRTHEEEVRNFIISHLESNIGDYKGCTFKVPGEGTFVPLVGSHPAIGNVGALEKVAESSISFMAPLEEAWRMIEKIKTVHPYEEMAYDLFELKGHELCEGIGRYGNLEEPVSLSRFIETLKTYFNIDYLRLTTDDVEGMIKRIALCSGAGSDYIKEASRVADVYVTGDLKFHEAQLARSLGLVVIDVGHYASESRALTPIGDCLIETFKDCQVIYSKVNGETLFTK